MMTQADIERFRREMGMDMLKHQHAVESQPNQLDYEPDAWEPLPETEAELFALLQGWARK